MSAIEELVDKIRSVNCVDPSRCGKHGWRVCDFCEDLQVIIEDLLNKKELKVYTKEFTLTHEN